jgi:hypothetical protein
MNKNVKGIITVLVVLGVGFFAYKKFLKPDNKKIVLKHLATNYGVKESHKSFVDSADKGYIDSWANAIKIGSETFTYNGKTFYTLGGTTKN